LAADARLRDGLLAEAIANSWPSTKLGEVIQQRRGTAGQGGRRPDRPKNLDDAIDQIKRPTEAWRKRNDEVWSKPGCSLASLAGELQPEPAPEELVERLRDLPGLLEQLERQAQERAAEAKQVLRGLRTRLRCDR
jgi:hypothetical protein